jgi:outer membrane murein-binding lipoprotein Lpp
MDSPLEALTDEELDDAIVEALAEVPTKPGTANVTPGDRKKLAGLLKHYAGMAHPFTACKRDQIKHGLSEDHANKRCAVVKDLIHGGTGWRKGGDGKMSFSPEAVEHFDLVLEAARTFDEPLDSDFTVFAAKASDDEEVSPFFEILRAGKYVKGGRTIQVTEADLDKAVENFNRVAGEGVELPTDYDHSFVEGRGSKASGWYKALKRNGKSLMARVKWTDTARQAIKNQEYRFFSSEFSHNAADEHGGKHGFAILSGTLTNRPFLRGMGAVALHEDIADQLADALEENSPGADETRDEMADTITLSESDHKTLVEKAGKVEALTSQVETLSGQVEKLTTEKSDAVDRAEKAEGEVADAKFNEIFSDAKRHGRVDAKDETETKWRERFDEWGFDQTKEVLSELPAEQVPVESQGRTGKPVETENVPEGTDEESFADDAKVKARMAEKDIDYAEAFSQLEREGALS